MAKVKVAAWRAAIVFACIAVASFIVFDALDLDGSNVSSRSNGAALMADAPTLAPLLQSPAQDAEKTWNLTRSSVRPAGGR